MLNQKDQAVELAATLPTVTVGQVVAAVLRRQASDLIRQAQKLEDEAMTGKEPKKRDRSKPESMRDKLKRLRTK